MNLSNRLNAYYRLIRLDKPIGILLLLWPTLWALWLASDGMPYWKHMLIFTLGVVFMRSAGCAINDYADRDFDGQVSRTSSRPLATGEIKPWEAIMVFSVLALAAFCLVLTLNWETIRLSFVAVFLSILYPFMKRYTHFPQLFLGVAFAMAIPMAYAVTNQNFSIEGWILFAATVIWALIYDTEYAMVDRQDDLKVGIKSTAILFGRHDRLVIGLLQLSMMSLLVIVGLMSALSWVYFIGLLFASLFFIQQQRLIFTRHPQKCFQAFINNNCFGMTVFFAFLTDSIIRTA